MKASIVVILCYVFTGSNAGSSNCPTSQWFDAEFVSISDKAAFLPIIILDSSLSFFRDIMLFTEEEIAQVEEDAIQFFNTRFGLDFSQSQPDEQGRRFYRNAILSAARLSPDVQYTATFNHWIMSGSTKSRCFETRLGSWRVDFSGEQILHGTYGGEEGIPVVAKDILNYGFYNIPVCPQEPLVIRFTTPNPIRQAPHDGFYIMNLDAFHRVWGRGLIQGVGKFAPTEDGRVHFYLREIFTFPAHPTFIP